MAVAAYNWGVVNQRLQFRNVRINKAARTRHFGYGCSLDGQPAPGMLTCRIAVVQGR